MDEWLKLSNHHHITGPEKAPVYGQTSSVLDLYSGAAIIHCNPHEECKKKGVEYSSLVIYSGNKNILSFENHIMC